MPPPSAPRPAPDRDKGGKGKTIGIIVAVAVVVAGVIVLLLTLLGRDSGGVKYSELQPGNCFQEPSGRFNNVKTVDCAEAHHLEVYAVLDHPAGPNEEFPGQDELVRYANPLCLAQFQGYTGVPFEQLNLADKYITPSDDAWNDGARRLVCVAGPSSGEQTTGSIRAGA
jgi:hypothetical protein